MNVAFVIPTHNEAAVIGANLKILDAYLRSIYPDENWRIIVADNGSSDDTREIVRCLSKELPQVELWQTDQKGRGNALRRVWQEYDADLYAYMDADLATDLRHIRELLEALDDADLAMGSRLLSGARVDRSLWRELISQTYSRLVRAVLGVPFYDLQCGFKAIRAEAARALLPETEHNGWFFDTELLALAHWRGYRVAELPIEWVETRTRGRKSTVNIAGTAANNLRELWKLKKRLNR